MPDVNPPFDSPTTDTEFHELLSTLVRTAHSNGVAVEGGWDVKSTNLGRPRWGIEIYLVAAE